MNRRSMLTDHMEPLSLVVDPWDVIERTDLLVEVTGVPLRHWYASPLVSVPLPIGPARIATMRRAELPELKAEALWHPLLWLPEELAYQLRLETPDGEVTAEGLDPWSIRVAFELETSGVFSPAEGWIDVLALHDIDLADPHWLSRANAWLDGVHDEVFDSISLDDFFRNRQDWDRVTCYRLADQVGPMLAAADRALAAKWVLDRLEEAQGRDYIRGAIAVIGALSLEGHDWQHAADRDDDDSLRRWAEQEWNDNEAAIAQIQSLRS